MNRKMRRMLAKNGGKMEGLMNNPEFASLMDGLNFKTIKTLMKDPENKKLFDLLKKHKKEEGTCVCPECGKEMHYKGALCTCEHCGKFVVVKEICGDEIEDNAKLKEVMEVLNSTNS